MGQNGRVSERTHPHRRTVTGAALSIGLVAGLLSGGPALAGTTRPAAVPVVDHVFVIVLENESWKSTFGDPAADPYLARTLPAEGALLTRYYGVGHESNDNYIAMISGQAPNLQSQADCQIYDDFAGTGPLPANSPLFPGQAVGTGCIYPQSVPTIANQLTENGLTWKGYMEDMGNVASRESAVCGHPSPNSRDKTQTAVAGDGYVARHDPFVYFRSIIDSPGYCDAHVVPLGGPSGSLPAGAPQGTTGLATDLRKASTTPNLSYIVPNVCDDGHDYPCTNQPSGPSALADIDAFLARWVPLITSSPAYRQGGLLVVTFDESDGPQADSAACCGELPGPGSPLPGITGPGGGRIGAVVLSPSIRGGTVDGVGFNHYSLLASIEGFFGLPRLGYAATATTTFERDLLP